MYVCNMHKHMCVSGYDQDTAMETEGSISEVSPLYSPVKVRGNKQDMCVGTEGHLMKDMENAAIHHLYSKLLPKSVDNHDRWMCSSARCTNAVFSSLHGLMVHLHIEHGEEETDK